ncbi:hypothetical protein [Synoicihabitans lomoniglobus]|uniref:Uncharacterized protein n=1 Tax=Synoicihabitans lomoniglobus TaxID=2909285 RepID=A0AAF0CSM9_9BACT|nr:hypothetical protein [Opitutaceae bacterium LMO-M01]WED67337.1 hypothetical protein PXH66_10800 [Opitutaceae bacterium LMO-M01]
MSLPLVTLQISLAPSDFRHARYLLPHQISTWRGQVDEILLTIDLHRSAGRFAIDWEVGRDRILELAHSIADARIVTVDYEESAEQKVAETFLGGKTPVPRKDFRGGPYYAYLFGLSEARHDHVLHLDSDLLFGGHSPHWMKEALADQAADERVLISAPLPGPPAPDGALHSQVTSPVPNRPNTHDFDFMSTRLFMLSKTRFRDTIRALEPRRPPVWRDSIKAMVEGNPAEDLPEHLFTSAMRKHGLVRREFLGTGKGMWHLHPPYRCRDFYDKLPDLIARCKSGDIPYDQRGDHDINDSLVDWTEARTALAHNRWWRRLAKRL